MDAGVITSFQLEGGMSANSGNPWSLQSVATWTFIFVALAALYLLFA